MRQRLGPAKRSEQLKPIASRAVAESNVAAIEIYQRLGFRIIGTVPGGFAHPTLGRVGLHIMY